MRWIVGTLVSVMLVAFSLIAPHTGGMMAQADAATSMPPLPAEIKARGYLSVGVKCDWPPFGFIDADGKTVGFDVDVARQLAQYAFGSPDAARFTCVTANNRVGYIDTKRIDLIVAVMSWTPERAKLVHFSTPYFEAGGLMLVPTNSNLSDFKELKGKSVITTKGAIYATWFQQCQPDTQIMEFADTSEALAALQAGRAPAFVSDDTLLVGLAEKNPALKMVGSNPIALGPWGLGTRLNDPKFSAWVDAGLAQMQDSDSFWKIFQKWVKDPKARDIMAHSLPRPGHSLHYPTSTIFHCDVK
ncbi:MAG: substrate-binding periplasmic protein [Vulcanimicrobiaceae bacterium]